MAIVYRHIRLDKNEPFYIGIGKTESRAYDKSKRTKFWKKVINKTDYRIDILFDDLTWEEAQEKEKEFIKLYGRKDLKTGTLVNMTDGGEGVSGLKHSEVAKLKIGKASSERKRSESTKTKSSKSQPKCKACVVNDIVYHSVGFAAKQLGISQAMLSMWLNNKRKPGTKINIKNYGWV
jgi:hypothetical protein